MLPSEDVATGIPSEPALAPAPSREEIAALEQAAFERGVASARAQSEALDATCATLDRAIEEWRAAAATRITANRNEVLDLCRDLVRHWIQAELSASSEGYANYLDRALEDVREDESVRLLLGPADLARLEAEAAPALERWREGEILVVADPALGEGDFRLETANASLDGELDAVADRLRETLSAATAAAAPAVAEGIASEEDDA